MTAQSTTQNLMDQWGANMLPATPTDMDTLISVRDLILQFYSATGLSTLDEETIMQWLASHEYKIYPGQVGVYMVKRVN